VVDVDISGKIVVSCVEMVPLFERCAGELVDYWTESLDGSSSAVLPVGTDLTRTVRTVQKHR